MLTAKSAICATEPGNNTNSRRCSSHDSGYGLRAVFLVSSIVIKGAASSHVVINGVVDNTAGAKVIAC